MLFLTFAGQTTLFSPFFRLAVSAGQLWAANTLEDAPCGCQAAQRRETVRLFFHFWKQRTSGTVRTEQNTFSKAYCSSQSKFTLSNPTAPHRCQVIPTAKFRPQVLFCTNFASFEAVYRGFLLMLFSTCGALEF
jgi:hypothetical protein